MSTTMTPIILDANFERVAEIDDFKNLVYKDVPDVD